jgi:hypothetical protein
MDAINSSRAIHVDALREEKRIQNEINVIEARVSEVSRYLLPANKHAIAQKSYEKRIAQAQIELEQKKIDDLCTRYREIVNDFVHDGMVDNLRMIFSEEMPAYRLVNCVLFVDMMETLLPGATAHLRSMIATRDHDYACLKIIDFDDLLKIYQILPALSWMTMDMCDELFAGLRSRALLHHVDRLDHQKHLQINKQALNFLCVKLAKIYDTSKNLSQAIKGTLLALIPKDVLDVSLVAHYL